MPDDRFLHRRAGHSQKVNLLTDLEYRVWTQYLLSADDFGVMRLSPVTLQADNDHLANRPAKVIQRCLDALTKEGGLLRVFDHQNRRYVYQHDWQKWQKVAYPRATNQPAPSSELLAGCEEMTQRLFTIHPGGAGKKRPEHSEKILEIVSEDSPLMRASAPAKRLTANGKRLTANGSEGKSEGEPPPLDRWLRELTELYPVQGRTSGHLTVTAFCDAAWLSLAESASPLVDASDRFALIKANLETQKAGAQWAKGMIPRLDRWLREGLWQQRHDPSGTDRASSKLPVWAQPKPKVVNS